MQPQIGNESVRGRSNSWQLVIVYCYPGNWSELVCTWIVQLLVSRKDGLHTTVRATYLFRHTYHSLVSYPIFSHCCSYLCSATCSGLPWLQGHLTPTEICSLILDAGASTFALPLQIRRANTVTQIFDSCTLSGLALSYILRVAAVGFLNYTQLNFLKSHCPTYVFVLSKLTIFLLFFVCLTNLLATLLALTVEADNFRQSVGDKFSLSLRMINALLRDFGSTTFRFKLMNFFWQKLFIDDRNILCNHTYLPWESDDDGWWTVWQETKRLSNARGLLNLTWVNGPNRLKWHYVKRQWRSNQVIFIYASWSFPQGLLI